MAELKDVLGATLRDIAQSRVISDEFSAEVSREYEQNAILSLFPVPRVEIREASINLKFAVNAVEKRPVDLSGRTRALAAQGSAELAAEVFRDVIGKHPRAAEVLGMIESKNLALRQRIQAAALDAILADPRALEAARKGDTEALAREISAKVSTVLMEDADVKKLLTSRGFRVATIRDALQEKALEAAARLGSELAAAAAAAERQAFGIDVGVTRKDLAETPEALVSQISIVAQIRNYEWVEVGEEEGKPVKRLRPE
jgi:predicted nucleic acid-binding protein